MFFFGCTILVVSCTSLESRLFWGLHALNFWFWAGEEWGSESSFSFHVHLLSLSLCSGLFILPGLQRQADSNSCHFTRWSETTIIYSMVTSWLVCSSPDRSIRVRALVGEIVLCSWAKHITFTLPLSTQVYKWVPSNLILGVTKGWTSIPSRGGVEILLVASC